MDTSDNIPGTDIVATPDGVKMVEVRVVPQGAPITVPATLQVEGTAVPEPPTDKELLKQIDSLLTKASKVGLEKLLEMINKLPAETDIEKFTSILMRILDARMALDWSERFEKAILKNPNYMSANKTNGPKSSSTQGKAATLAKVQKGDGRTTPKKLLANLPKDEEGEVA